MPRLPVGEEGAEAVVLCQACFWYPVSKQGTGGLLSWDIWAAPSPAAKMQFWETQELLTIGTESGVVLQEPAG